MNGTLNPRLTIVIVFAFLFIVALFVGPGGPADQVVPPPALPSAAPLTTPRPSPSPSIAASTWYTQEEPTPPAVSPTPGNDGGNGAANAPAAPAEGSPMVAPPPPQGPDFPENQ
ncbi:hypothetical protein [Novosphingobium aerophilum]|jgi:hypothetical protein|uniref:Uncharacterized protein n=1 Tax=Novosphingobium aerophilum TaxID=2839843 RepID=A0A7X1KDQ6_9SPHN|nr:hypothetical protein [Novosphingobium aerophilum]MBC2653407.1 hypothetical protein [Novosphingobium aerophilum]